MQIAGDPSVASVPFSLPEPQTGWILGFCSITYDYLNIHAFLEQWFSGCRQFESCMRIPCISSTLYRPAYLPLGYMQIPRDSVP